MENAPQYDLEKWLKISNTNDGSASNRRSKKRRQPLKKNRKPSRPANYIGQRSNNNLLRIFDDQPSHFHEPQD